MKKQLLVIVTAFFILFFNSCSEFERGIVNVYNDTLTDTVIELSDNQERKSRMLRPREEIPFEYDSYCFVFLSQNEKRKYINRLENEKKYVVRDKPTTTETAYFTNITGSAQVVFNIADDLTGEISIPAFVESPNPGDPDYKNHPVSISWMLGLDLQVKSEAAEKPVIETKIENGKKYILIREPGYTIP